MAVTVADEQVAAVDALTVDGVLRQRARLLGYGRGVTSRLRVLLLNLGASHLLVGSLSDAQLQQLSGALKAAARAEQQARHLEEQRRMWGVVASRVRRAATTRRNGYPGARR